MFNSFGLAVTSLRSSGFTTLQGPGLRPTRVILDPETFRENFSIVQAHADLVAFNIDRLIPGQTSDYPDDGIVVFEGSPEFQVSAHYSGPVTLMGPKLAGEPTRTSADIVRIGLSGTQPAYMRRFIYQLAHELAHVKMGPRVSNSLIETFATAVSLEVLERMGLFDYSIPVILKDLRQLPEEIQAHLAEGEFLPLRNFYQSRAAANWKVGTDRPIQTLGSLLMKVARAPDWNLLLGVALLAIGTTESPGQALYQPDIPAMKLRGVGVDSLGY